MDYIPVTVISAAANSQGKLSSRQINAKRFETDSQCAYIFEPTKREIAMLGFDICPGSTIIDNGKRYICKEIQSGISYKQHIVCAIVEHLS